MKCFPHVESLERRDTPSPTFTGLASSADPSVYGQPVLFAVAVVGGDFPPGTTNIVPETVTLYADGQPFATVPLVNGNASFVAPRPNLGVHYIQARYNGGTVFDGWQVLHDDASFSNVWLQVTLRHRPHHHH